MTGDTNFTILMLRIIKRLFFTFQIIKDTEKSEVKIEKDSKKIKQPFILTEFNGNPHLVWFRDRNNEALEDAESFNLFIAKGETKKDDILFIGGDFNNQAFHSYKRIE